MPKATKNKKLATLEQVSAMYDVDPAYARELIDTYGYESQRPIDDKWVNFLANEMRERAFTLNVIVLAQLKDKAYLVNGQHTLRAIMAAGVTLSLPIVYYECRSAEDLALLYSTLDQGKKRRAEDAFKPYNLDTLLGFNTLQLRSLTAAVGLLENDLRTVKSARQSFHQLKDPILMWGPHFKPYLACIDGSVLGKRMLRRDLAVMGLITFREIKNQAFVADFWKQVATPDGLGARDPRLVLHRWVIETQAAGRDRVGGVTINQALRVVAYAWNAYHAGKDIRSIRIETEKPIKILGTSYE